MERTLRPLRIFFALAATLACDGGRAPVRAGADASTESTSSNSTDAAAPDSSDAFSPPPADAPFVVRLAAALCVDVAGCCARARIPHDIAACSTAEEAYLRNHVRGGIGPNVRYDPVADKACLDAVAAYTARCSGPVFGWILPDDPTLAVCKQVLQGTRQLGESCRSWEECDSSAGYVTCDAGACHLNKLPTDIPLPPVLRIGEACTVISNPEVCDSRCERGSFCDRTGHCAAQHAAGDCTDQCQLSCTDASFCDSAQGVCRPKLPEGSACTGWGSCQGENVHCLANKCVADLLELCTSPNPR